MLLLDLEWSTDKPKFGTRYAVASPKYGVRCIWYDDNTGEYIILREGMNITTPVRVSPEEAQRWLLAVDD